MSLFFMPASTAFGQHVRGYPGAMLYFYEQGTITTKATYTTDAETIAHSDPVIANGEGVFDPIYLTGNYKVALHDEDDVLIWSADNVPNVLNNVDYKGDFNSSTNGGDYPVSGELGHMYRVSTGFKLDPTSGSHILETGDFIICNKNAATGIDADWGIMRTADHLDTNGKRTVLSLGTDQDLNLTPTGTGDTHATTGDIVADTGNINAAGSTKGFQLEGNTVLNSDVNGKVAIASYGTNQDLDLDPAGTGVINALAAIKAQGGISFDPYATENLLDDYEEDTWTPGVGGTATYGASNYGSYTKIGDTVFISGTLHITLIGTGDKNSILGFPFTSAITNNTGIFSTRWSATATALGSLTGFMLAGSTTMNLYAVVNNESSPDAFDTIFGDGTFIFFSGHYKV